MTGPVVVAGEDLVDLILDTQGGLRATLGGGPYNTARTIGRLGGRVAFLGCVSRDRFGEQLFQALSGDGVETSLTVRTGSPSTLAMAELDAHNAASYRFYVEGTAAPELTAGMAGRALETSPWALHLGTLGLVFEPIATSLEALVEALPAATWLMLDPNARPSATPDLGGWRKRVTRIAARASIIRVTTDDLAVLAPGVDPVRAARAMLDQGPTVVVLTDGPHAVQIIARDRPPTTLPVPSVRVVDTVGSGDAFGGGLVAWWQAHDLGREDFGDPAAVESATRAAIRVAAITCTRPGADPPTLDELGGWD